MVKLRHLGSAFIAGMFLTAIAMDAADARRGGGGGGGRGAGIGGGRASIGSVGGNRLGNIGARPSNPIAGGNRLANVGGPRPSHPISGVSPGGPVGPGGPGRPGGPIGPGGPGWGGGYWPGYGWGIGAAAVGVGVGLGYSDWCDPYYNSYCNGGYTTGYSDPYGVTSDAVEYCARTFKTYDRASQTYIATGGRRASCP